MNEDGRPSAIFGTAEVFDKELAKNPVTDFIESLSDDIQNVGNSWREVSSLRRSAISTDTVEELTGREIAYDIAREVEDTVSRVKSLHDKAEEAFWEWPRSRREERRRQSRNEERENRNIIKQVIQKSQTSATLLAFGSEEEREKIGRDITLATTELEISEDEPTRWPPVHLAANKLFIDLTDSYKTAFEGEVNLLEKISPWLAHNPNHLIHLAEWMESDDCDENEHRPLLEALARNYFDSQGISLIGEYTKQLADNPQLHQRSIANRLVSEAANPVEHEPENHNRSWVRFILSEGLGLDQEALTDLLATVPMDRLPPLEEEVLDSHNEQITDLKRRYDALLKPHDKTGRHFAFSFPGIIDAELLDKPRVKRAKAGRTTKPNGGNGQIKEQEDEPVPDIATAYIGRHTSTRMFEGRPLTSEKDEEKNCLELLMASKPVKEYLAKYHNNPDLTQDMEDMLASILKTPRGDGAEKMTDQRISLTVDETTKKVPVWHLNPNERHVLSLKGDHISRQTRIYYSLWPVGKGEEAIVLLDVDHKSSAEKQNGRFRALS